MALTQVSPGLLDTTAQYYGFKNRIINGAMVIDQRNAGASVTPIFGTLGFPVDRFSVEVSQASKLTAQQNAGSVTPPAGFTNYLGITSSSAYSVTSTDFFRVGQRIEGFNVADLAWGTANAQAVTISFWVRSSLTGLFGASVQNAAVTRTYPFSYSIPVANTWTFITVTIPGDTTGTWLTTNGIGIFLQFGLGVGSTYIGTADAWAAGNFVVPTGSTSVVGTSGATFYITGVQLEKGSTATSFDYRPYGTELALCQRYYQRNTADAAYTAFGAGDVSSTTVASVYVKYSAPMRSSPTLSYSGAISVYSASGNYAITSVNSVSAGKESAIWQPAVSGGGMVAGRGCTVIANNSASAYIELSAEL